MEPETPSVVKTDSIQSGQTTPRESFATPSSEPTLADKIANKPKTGILKPCPKAKRDRKAGEPLVEIMFRQRMKREGRSVELENRVRPVMEERGLLYRAAMRLYVMPAMGFISDEAEVRLYRQHMMDVHHVASETIAAEDAEEERLRTADEEYEEALMTLPPNAPKAKELEWIEAHPAMMRQSRLQAGSKSSGIVLLMAKDILNAPHGLCPSRSAANQLQHWVNHSQKFFEQIMSEAKKKSTGDGAGGDGSETVEDNLDDLDASLAQHGL